MNLDTSHLTIFFCIGCQKSGTTLLARVLDQHPKIACIWESYALRPQRECSIMNLNSDAWQKNGFDKDEVAKWSYTWEEKPNIFYKFIRRLSGRDLVRERQFYDTMSSAFLSFSERCNATVVGDKWPMYIDHIDTVVQAFPKARFIYNVRDPRGIWNSAQRFKGRNRGDEILQEMLKKDRIISPYLNYPNFFTLRYEDLLFQTELTVKQLYQFLGCDFSEKYLVYDPQLDPLPKRWGWVPEAHEQFNAKHAVKWKDEMTFDEIKRVNQISDWFIKKYHYEE
jgi:hypothetical protein